MSYAPCNSCYSAGSSRRLEGVVNKFYINGDVNINNGSVNNGIQHSIAAQKVGDVQIYSQNIDNRVQNNYFVNMDNRKIDFISPYIGSREGKKHIGYGSRNNQYLLPSPSGKYDNSHAYEGSSITVGLLRARRPITQFVADAAEVEHLVRETFETLTDQAFPDDIIVRVLDEKEMAKAHQSNGGKWNPGIMGFAINRDDAPSSIFIKQNHLDELMLVIGHELGHVLTARLDSELDEEAKAFAFELAWAKCLVENNIGGLGASFDVDFTPAANGLHDKAFAFVQSMVRNGENAMKVFWKLAKGILTTRRSPSLPSSC